MTLWLQRTIWQKTLPFSQRKIFFILIMAAAFLSLTIRSAQAQDYYGLEGTAEDVLGEDAMEINSTAVIVGFVLQGALAFVGVVFLILFVYAGARWMTARGNNEDVEKAKKTMINSTLGIAVVLAAYAITKFVVDAIVESATK